MAKRLLLLLLVLMTGMTFRTSQASGSCQNTLIEHDIGDISFKISRQGIIVYLVNNRLYALPVNGGSNPIFLNNSGSRDYVWEFDFTPDGTHIVYLSGSPEHISIVSVSGGTPVRLDNNHFGSGFHIHDFEISPDNRYILYHGDANLYSVPADGSRLPIMISKSMSPPDGIGTYLISPDSRYVVYKSAQNGPLSIQLYSAPIDGSASPMRLSALQDTYNQVGYFQFSPNGHEVYFSAGQITFQNMETFLVPVDGSSPPSGINPIFTGTVTPDQSRVIYLANSLVVGAGELESLRLDGEGRLINLTGTIPSDALFGDFKISPDGEYVVYTLYGADEINGTSNLYSVRADGGEAPILLQGDFPRGGGVATLTYSAITPDSRQLIYLADAEGNKNYALYSVPLNGNGSPLGLTHPLWVWDEYGFPPSFYLMPNGRYVLFSDRHNLEAVSVTGGAPIQISNLPAERGVSIWVFAASADSQNVIYTAQLYGETQLYSVRCSFNSAFDTQNN